MSLSGLNTQGTNKNEKKLFKTVYNQKTMGELKRVIKENRRALNPDTPYVRFHR